MITNIIDNRARPYRWKSINAVAEATSHDNSVADADIAPETADDLTYDQRESISLAEAIQWAANLPGDVTFYLYDEGAGTS